MVIPKRNKYLTQIFQFPSCFGTLIFQNFNPLCFYTELIPSNASKTAAPISRYVNVTTIRDNVRTLRLFMLTPRGLGRD